MDPKKGIGRPVVRTSCLAPITVPNPENLARAGIIAQRMPLTDGTKLGPYELRSLIGAGGMGEVYRAHDSRLNRTVAIKVLPSSFSADRDRLQRFAQEARAAAALNHPNILSIYDIGEEKGSPYVVSELLEGETLRERLRTGALPVRASLITPRRSRAAWLRRTRRELCIVI